MWIWAWLHPLGYYHGYCIAIAKMSVILGRERGMVMWHDDIA